MAGSESNARVNFSLVRDTTAAGTIFAVAPQYENVAEFYQIKEKLLAAYEEQDLVLTGSVNSTGDLKAEGIYEDGWRLSDDDFEMFCLSMDIPYIPFK